jgi:gamma-glutamyl hydrolase
MVLTVSALVTAIVTYFTIHCSNGVSADPAPQSTSHHVVHKSFRGQSLNFPSQPVIGVLTQPFTSKYVPDESIGTVFGSTSSSFGQPSRSSHGSEYVASGYVKFVEQAGARVVAIQFTLPPAELRSRLSEIHGIILPGGANDLTPGKSPFMRAAAVVWEHVLDSNKRGERFAVFGTCQGWEMLAVLSSKAGEVVLDQSGPFNSAMLGSSLEFTRYAREQSELFSELSPTLLDTLASEPLTVNEHTQGVTPEVLESDNDLKSMWRVLATSVDRDGKQYVAAVEARGLKGVFATQFHPEKAQFTWAHTGTGTIERSHTEEGAVLGQHLSNVFVRHARYRATEQPAAQVVNAWEIDLLGRRVFVGDTTTDNYDTLYVFDSYKPTTLVVAMDE